MPKKSIKYISKKLWGFTAIFLVVVALYVNAGRILLPMVDTAQQTINELLSDAIGLEVVVKGPRGGWSGFTPDIRARGFAIKSVIDKQSNAVSAGRIIIKPDVLSSLKQRELVFKEILLEDLVLTLEQSDSGVWKVSGLPSFSRAEEKAVDFDPLLDFLFYSERLELTRVKLQFKYSNGNTAPILPADVLIENSGDRHHLTAAVDMLNQPLQTKVPGFHLQFEAIGDPREDKFSAKAYSRWSIFNLSAVLPMFGDLNYDQEQYVPADGELWGKWTHRHGLKLHGKMSASEIPLQLANNTLTPLRDFSVEFGVRYLPLAEWDVVVNDLMFEWNDVDWKTDQLALNGKHKEENVLYMDVDRLDLKKIATLVNSIEDSPKGLVSALAALKPEGEIVNVHSRIPLSKDASEKFYIKSNLSNVSNLPWKGAPGSNNVNGYLYADTHGGYVDLNTKELSLLFPTVYKDSLYYDIAQGQVAWTIDAIDKQLLVSSSALTLVEGEVDAKAQFYLKIPMVKSEEEPELYLMAGINQAPISHREKYLPYILSENLLRWLDTSIESGDLQRTAFIFRGSLRQGVPENKSVQLNLEVRDAVLRYEPSWPKLTALDTDVIVDNTQIFASSDKAKIFNSNLQDVSVELAPYEGKPGSKLQVKGELNGDTADGLRILKESPIRASLGGAIDSWDLSGVLKATIDLEIPLGNKTIKPKQQVDVSLTKSRLILPDVNLKFNNIHGDIQFSDVDGLTSSNLKANFWQRKVDVDIQNPFVSYDGVKSREILVTMRGQANVQNVIDWTGLSLLRFVEGQASYRAQLKIFGSDPGASEDNTAKSLLSIYSDLKGADLNLPSPLGKTTSEKIPLHLELPIGVKEPSLHIRYGKQLDFALLEKDKALYSAHVVIGGGYAKQQEREGLLVSGNLPIIDFPVWQQVFDRYQIYTAPAAGSVAERDEDARGGNASEFSLRLVDINADVFKYNDFSLESLNAKIHRSADAWNVEAKSPMAAGQLTFYDDDRPDSYNMTYVRLPESADEKEPSAQGYVEELFDVEQFVLTDPLLKVDPSNLPTIDFSTQEFSIGEKNFGRWFFDLRPYKSGARLENLYGELKSVRLHGETVDDGALLDWQYQDGKHKTKLIGKLSFADISDALNQWGMESFLTSKDGQFSGELDWPGSPALMDLDILQGKIALKIKSGYFVQIQAPNPTLRLVSLFNFATYARRLSLDFADFSDKGLSFDKVEGMVDFQGGSIAIVEPIEVASISSEIRMSGKIDLIDETLDTKVVFVLPFNTSLPWVAAMAGGLPVAAGVYVVTKIFEDQVERLSSASYVVHGAWDEPKVELEKIFDNKDSNYKPQVPTEESPTPKSHEKVPLPVAVPHNFTAADTMLHPNRRIE